MTATGLQPILIKGWAAARLYPETGLRPYGDIDVCVRPDQLAAAKKLLHEAAGSCGWVELHEGVPDRIPRRPVLREVGDHTPTNFSLEGFCHYLHRDQPAHSPRHDISSKH